MAIKTFSSGEVLTAADTNTYLNNGGLVYLKTVTWTTGVPTVNVPTAFTSEYADYLITIVCTVTANQPNLGLRLGATVASYAYSGFYQNFTGGALTVDSGSAFTYFNLGACGNGTVGAGRVAFQAIVKRPQIADNTFYNAQNGSLAWSNCYTGYMNNSTQYTDFTILPSSGNISSGTINVYGYRKV